VFFDNLGKNEKTKEPNAKTARRPGAIQAVDLDQIIYNTMDLVKDFIMWSSYEEHIEDALALRGDEGRDRLR
jgi:hypothetical protein